MTSKLIRFSSGIELSKAAEWLSRLIEEEIHEDTFIDLNIDGYLNLGVCGPFLGLPVWKPEGDGNWMIDLSQSGTNPGRLYATALYEPLRLIDTELGEAPAYSVDGKTYAFFYESHYYEPELSVEEVVKVLKPIDLDECVCVHPEDVLRVAQLANSTEPRVDAAAPPRETRASSTGTDLLTKYHRAEMIDEGVPKERRPSLSAARDATAPHLLIAILLEMLNVPRRLGLNQSGVISEILEAHPSRRGLSKRNLEKIFAEANREYKSAE